MNLTNSSVRYGYRLVAVTQNSKSHICTPAPDDLPILGSSLSESRRREIVKTLSQSGCWGGEYLYVSLLTKGYWINTQCAIWRA